MTTFTKVADNLNIGKRFKQSSQHYGKLCDPIVERIVNEEYPKGKYILRAETWRGCADVVLIDYMTSDYHLFDTEQEAINAWVGRIPQGCNWNH